MVELFEFVMAKPLEFFAGIGISSATIFTMIKFLSWFISLFTKSKKLLKEKQYQEAIANAVISKFGGVNNFISQIVDNVINALGESEFNSNLNKSLEELKKLSNCPIELKAYIKTILTQDGNHGIYLDYEKTLREFNELKNNNIQVDFVNEKHQAIEPVQIIPKTEVINSSPAEENDGDIEYA